MNFKKIFIGILVLAGCRSSRLPDAVSPVIDGTKFRLEIQNQVMEIDPAIGGRITSLKMDGRDFLTDSTVNRFNWGSTFWPSPQSEWRWPPSPTIDNLPYMAQVHGKVIRMVSGRDPKTGYVVTKEFSASRKAGAFVLKFTITNHSDSTRKVAPWEVTRVHPKGLAFFPIGKGERSGGLLPLLLERDGISWFVYQVDKLPVSGDRQIYADGAEGWLAQLNDDVLLVKKFPDIPIEKAAPKEGEVELFASGVTPAKPGYVEIEHQGAYESLKPGASTSWEVTWFLRKLPPGMAKDAGSPALVEYVRGLVK